MTTRHTTNEHRTLGHVAVSSKSPDNKAKPIVRLMIYPREKYSREIWLEILADGMRVPNIRLRPDAALEIVKGILQGLPDISIIADDELLAIFRDKLATEQREMQTIQNVLKERRGS